MVLLLKVIRNIIILCLLTNCSITKKHYLGTLENIKYVVSHEDSLKIDSVRLELKEATERIELENKRRREKNEKSDAKVNCFDSENYAEFRGGTNAFRQFVYENFKVPKKTKSGENTILVTIGKQNNLEKVEILKYTDEETKKSIEDLFKLKELHKWRSAELFRVPVKQQFELSIFIENKK